MEIRLILLQIVLNLDQRVKHLLINKVNQYSLCTVFLPKPMEVGNRGEGGRGEWAERFPSSQGGRRGCLNWTIV